MTKWVDEKEYKLSESKSEYEYNLELTKKKIDKLYKLRPDDKFFQDLHKRVHTGFALTKRQIEVLEQQFKQETELEAKNKEYEEKIKRENAGKKTPKKEACEFIAKSLQHAFHECQKNNVTYLDPRHGFRYMKEYLERYLKGPMQVEKALWIIGESGGYPAIAESFYHQYETAYNEGKYISTESQNTIIALELYDAWEKMQTQPPNLQKIMDKKNGNDFRRK